ncbi:MAG: DNA-binding protein [Bacteroidetes bacterium]|nr:MAG: DNA-binding protein [Bacteroidota bacterium]
MSRPVRHRRMQRPPLIKGLIPYGGQVVSDEVVMLLMEEYEAIRLMDYEMLNQVTAAKMMNVSRPTFTRIYDSARKKISKVLVLSLKLEIGGGNVELQGQWYTCNECHAIFEIGDVDINDLYCSHCNSKSLGSINDQLLNHERQKHNYFQRDRVKNDSDCVCPDCGFKISHKRGVPCRKANCPKCNIPLYRK